MEVIYEINPPKIFEGSTILNIDKLNQEIDKFLHRSKIILDYANHIHVTDSVLGIPRISSLHGAALVSENIKNKNIILSCSIRTRDRNINSIIQLATQSIFLNITELLFIMGDNPQINVDDVPLKILSKPTDAINMLNSLGYNKFINLNLSIPNKISNYNNFKKKINSNPHGLVTQSISSLQEVKDLKNLLNMHSIRLIPCVMVPSDKNRTASQMIGLNFENYKYNFMGFIQDIKKEVNQILITSPNDFNEGIRTLKEIKNLNF
jgi:5,10-methylenetetrahydrofolate reductase